MEVDDAWKQVATKKKWHILFYLSIMVLESLPTAWNMMSIVWIAFKPNHHCLIPNNSSLEEWLPKNQDGSFSSCEIFIHRNQSNQSEPCPNGWFYNISESGPTIVTQWDLVCDKGHLVETLQLVLICGVLIGALFFPKLSDHVGRKKIFVFSSVLMTILNFIFPLSPNLTCLFILRFFLGMIQQGVMLTGAVLCLECMPTNIRTFAAIIGSGVWGAINSLLPLVALLTKNWFYFQMVVSISQLIFLPVHFWLPESSCWLHVNGKSDEAEEIIWKAAKFNGIILKRPFLKRILPKETKETKGNVEIELALEDPLNYSIKDIVTNFTLRKHLIISIAIWVATNLVYYGLNLNTFEWSGDKHLNFFFSFFIEFPSSLIVYLTARKFGRRKTIFIFFIITSIPFFIISFCQFFHVYLPYQLSIFFNLLSKFAVSGAFACVYFYVCEIFPTNLRNQTIGICSFFGRIGIMGSSYSTILFTNYPSLANGLCGLIGALSAILILNLPEIKGRSLPETIEDIENWNKKTNNK